MKGVFVAAVACLLLSRPDKTPGSSALAADVEYLEPNVQRLVNFLPVSVCKELIDLGEKSGFLVEKESIDVDEQNDPDEEFVPSQTINIYTKGWREPGLPTPEGGHVIRIGDEAIWSLLQPWVPKITQIVKDNRNRQSFGAFYPDEPDREPELNWVFFRKYSPYDKRNSLQQHVDTNMNTVNIELSHDYEGGGLFYIKPSSATGEIADEYYAGYGWLETIKRENTSDIVFPDLHAGDAIFYNYTVRHGVAPVESGTRYSMAFFFDMDNPAVYEGEDDLEEFEVRLHNGFSDMELDVVLVYDAAKGKELWDILYDKVTPDETVFYSAYDGDLLRVLRSGTDEVVSHIGIIRDQSSYTLSQINLGSEL